MISKMGKTIWYNGNIVTMKTEGDSVEALCSCGEYILATGSLEDVKVHADDTTEYVDLCQRTVIPGLIEAHNHVTDGFINEFIEVSCQGAQSIDEVLELIAVNKRTLLPGEWVLGGGYSDTAVAEKRHLTRHDIDEVCADIPVALFNVSSHILYANTLALEIAGITAETDIPEGGHGEIILDSEGVPNGILLGHAYTLVINKVPAHSQEKYQDAYRKGFAYANSMGITSVQDGSIGWLGNEKNIIDALSTLKEEGALSLRFYLTMMEEKYRELIAGGLRTGFGDISMRLGSYKMLVDGSIQGYTAALTQPYHVTGMSDGLMHFTHDQLKTSIMHAHKNHCQVALHCNGDEAIECCIDAIEYAQNVYPGFEGRHILIHAQTIREDQLDRVAALNIVPSFFVNHVHYWGDVHRETFLGEERASRISPLQSANKRALPFNIHTDYPVTPLDPFRLLSCAVNRTTSSGKVLGKEQAVSIYDAVQAMTKQAAYSSFEEDLKGTLEVGKLADFVVLSEDIFNVDPRSLTSLTVHSTILGGKTVYSNNK